MNPVRFAHRRQSGLGRGTVHGLRLHLTPRSFQKSDHTERSMSDMGETRVDWVNLWTTTRHIPGLDSQAVEDMTEDVKGPDRLRELIK